MEPKSFPKSSISWNISFTALTVVGAALIHILSSVLTPRPTPIVTIDDGQVQGNIAFSRKGREYWQFLSIPYAEPPIDNLRFEPPVPVKPWKGLKKTTSWPPFCLQFEPVMTQRVFGEEDCLFLNVNALPFQNGDPLKPVIVHLHGGGFVFGGSRIYEAGYFMDEDVVVVTSNYRLGPFGFLNFEHDPRSDNVSLPRGNMGIKDQLLVLKWVQRNIAQFGGDPRRVTIIGESAGSVSVSLHLLSPKSRGLFHRAMSHSGTAFSSWGITSQPRKIAHNFAKRLNCLVQNSSEIFACLQNSDPREMVKLQVSSSDPTLPKDNLSPSVESVLMDDTFLHEQPSLIFENGNFSRVPYILGVSKGDGALRTGRFEALSYPISMLQENWTKMLGNVLLYDNLPPQVADLARVFYFGENKTLSSMETQTFLDKLTILFSDVFSFEPAERVAKLHAKSGAPTYLYYFDYIPPVTPGLYSAFRNGYVPGDWLAPEIKILASMITDWVAEHIFGGKGAHQYGASHGDEFLQLWNAFGCSKYLSLWELDFSENYVKVVTDFAKGINDLKFKGTSWPSINASLEEGSESESQSLPCMLMDNSERGEVIPAPFSERLRFWNAVGINAFH